MTWHYWWGCHEEGPEWPRRAAVWPGAVMPSRGPDVFGLKLQKRSKRKAASSFWCCGAEALCFGQVTRAAVGADS
jgi:hypothetical protein